MNRQSVTLVLVWVVCITIFIIMSFDFARRGMWDAVVIQTITCAVLVFYVRKEVMSWYQVLDLSKFHDDKAKWSMETFGPGNRYSGVVSHIREELQEIEEDPASLEEWVDVILLAMDGAWRSAGANGDDLVRCLQEKQKRNEKRKWADWRTLGDGEVSKHIGDG